MKNLNFYKTIYTVFAAVLFLSLPFRAYAQTTDGKISVSAILDRNTATIAERITYTLTIKYKENISLELDIPEKKTGVFTIEKSTLSKITKKSDMNIQTLTLVLSTLDTGLHLIPGVNINYYLTGARQNIKNMKPQSLQINIKSLLTDDKITDLSKLKDIKKPVTLAVDKKKITKIAAVTFGILLLIIILIVILRMYLKRKNQPVVIVKTPYEIAIFELNRLQNEHLIEHNQVKEYYFKLSVIIRKYLEGRFSLHAPKQTTEEFFRTISKNDILKDEYKKSLKTFLANCDFVKFAKYLPDEDEIAKTYSSAKDFVESSREKEEKDAD